MSYLSAYKEIDRFLLLGVFTFCLVTLLGYMLIQLRELARVRAIGPGLAALDVSKSTA